MTAPYTPTSVSLVRQPRRRYAQQAGMGAPTTAPGVNPAEAQPYGGNGVLPQPPAQPNVYLQPSGVNMFAARPPRPTPVAGVPAPAPAAAPPAAPPGATAIDPNTN